MMEDLFITSFNANDKMHAARNKMELDDTLSLDHISRVISIVSPSRAGSSVFKWCIARHPDVCSLAGEEEPYYKLACNGYPWHHSDAFSRLNAPEFVRLAIANELANHHRELNRHILKIWQVEEPPYVDSVVCKKTSTLVLKTPQNIYRRGVMDQLFPGRRIDYIFLSRGFAQTVNGLMDGWRSADFKARKVFGRWWKFDMPPGWTFDTNLLQKCFWQWKCASLHGLGDYPDAFRVKFEDFMVDGVSVCNRVFTELGLSPFTVEEPPAIMATKPPAPYRWKERGPIIMQLANVSEPVMTALGYSMSIEDWI